MQPPDAQDGERRDGECRDGERRDGERRDGEFRDGECRDGERRDGERRDGECRDGERRDGERRDGERRDGDDDRRDDERQPIELKVEYKRLNTFFSDYSKNISRGGTFIKTNRPLDVGTEFVFKLYVPQLPRPLAIHGQVQWVVTEADIANGVGREPTPGMGIRFIYHAGDSREDIERVVEKLMVDSLGQRLYSRLMAAAKSGS